MKPLLSLPIIHYLARSFGWPKLRQAAMNARFRSGAWSNYSEPPKMVSLVEHYANRGSIVVLGCGGNPLGRALDPNSYEKMTGVDLSPEAVAIARANAPERQDFHVQDMTTWKTDAPIDLVVISESIYYLPLEKIKPLLAYWKSNLKPKGYIIVTIVDPSRYVSILNMIRSAFHIEKDGPLLPGAKRHVIIFH